MEDACDRCSPLYIMTKCARKKCILYRKMHEKKCISFVSRTIEISRDWRYDAVYGTKCWAYERMRAVAVALLKFLEEEK